MTPCARIDRDSSSILASSIWVRGWNLLGRSRSVSTSSVRSEGAAAAGASGINALKPRPSAGRFSTMVRLRLIVQGGLTRQDLARERNVRFRASRLHVVEDRGEPMAGRLAEPDVARNHGGV